MPLLSALRKLACCAAPEQNEEEEPPVRRMPEPAQAGPARAERPCREYVEDEAERFRREPGTGGDPGQPRQELTPAQVIALKAVNAMQLHLIGTGALKPPYSRLHVYPNHVEALIQLADDAGWLAREVPLPVHPGPQHPTIYYTVDRETNRPLPMEDALIRGDYVSTTSGYRLTQAEHIPPWRGQDDWPQRRDLKAGNWDICYSLHRTEDTIQVMFHWIIESYNFPPIVMRLSVEDLHFSRIPPLPEW